ncbi:hypothetical protein BD769DRAFT_1450532, partial [Suillus cothurnatus]
MSYRKIHDVQSTIVMYGSTLNVPISPYFFFSIASLALWQAVQSSVWYFTHFLWVIFSVFPPFVLADPLPSQVLEHLG